MWPTHGWTPDEGALMGDPLHQDSTHDGHKENLRSREATLSATGSVSEAPEAETDDSIDLSELMTKPEKIIESQGASDWDWDFAGISNMKSAESDNLRNRFYSYHNPFTSTSLLDSDSLLHSQNLDSENSQSSHK